ncbi:MAG TPA: cell wall hydrolase [Sphingomicrobium sp.]
MKRFIGRRALGAAMGLFIVAAGAGQAEAQVVSTTRAGAVDTSAKPLGIAQALRSVTTATATAITSVTGSIIQTQPAASVTVSLAPSIAREAAWLYQNGWPLYALVDRYSTGAPLDQQANCLATAVYFEARGESLEGQLAVARVVMNRASSNRYPPDWCSVVKQPAQFSFVRNGQFPVIDYNSDAWRKAQAITRLAVSNAIPSLSNDVLWYHADYVAPSWGHRLQRVEKIGAHIFYRA